MGFCGQPSASTRFSLVLSEARFRFFICSCYVDGTVCWFISKDSIATCHLTSGPCEGGLRGPYSSISSSRDGHQTVAQDNDSQIFGWIVLSSSQVIL